MDQINVTTTFFKLLGLPLINLNQMTKVSFKLCVHVTSVVDPNTLNLDPDPRFWPNLDPDPDPGQDPDPG